MARGAAIVLATFRPRPEKAAELREELDTMIGHSRQEPGCETYDLYESGDDEVAYHLFERYSDAEALEAHRAADYYKAYRERLPDLLAQPVDVQVLREVDVAS